MDKTAGPERVGGHVALDFANTAAGRDTGHPVEHLPDVAALTGRVEASGLLDEEAIARVRDALSVDPELGRRTYDEATRLREAIHRVGQALAHGQEPDPRHVRRIAGWAAEAFAKGTLARTEDGVFRLDCARTPPACALLGPLALAMVELLSSPDVRRIGQCEGEGCGWLFIDRSRTGNRRWCDMRTCGNRNKAKRHRARR
ncbi:CGNR zinc finger domain-containing protein [Marinivivus vitaminiproducens]|uniref:CGNR zinc finger domain-containing protein n=1 Tax=Marinivivus vitaminiproducens TaxID=3035935 RepID=UPI00279FDFF3|nr:CGNR zinc finger domain-containing protein [Geminicoccaceae bacterium SCSIO 64248]